MLSQIIIFPVYIHFLTPTFFFIRPHIRVSKGLTTGFNFPFNIIELRHLSNLKVWNLNY